MIQKYFPLPDGWREMYDAGLGRHYYWCTKSDKVSWLPPGHPKAKITDPASKVREAMALKKSEEKFKVDNDDNMDLDSDNDDSDEEDRRIEEQRRREKERRKEEERRIVGSSKKRKGRGEDEGVLDPMDPASYSDVPRGTWATGLEAGSIGSRAPSSSPLPFLFLLLPTILLSSSFLRSFSRRLCSSILLSSSSLSSLSLSRSIASSLSTLNFSSLFLRAIASLTLLAASVILALG